MLVVAGICLVAIGIWLGYRVIQNPEPQILDCGDSNVSVTEDDRWVEVRGCELGLEDGIEVLEDDEVKEVWLPVYVPDAKPRIAVALLIVSRSKGERISEQLESWAASAAEDEPVPQQLYDSILYDLGAPPISGMTKTNFGRHLHLRQEAFPGSRAFGIKRGPGPTFPIPVGVILIGVGVFAYGLFRWHKLRDVIAGQAAWKQHQEQQVRNATVATAIAAATAARQGDPTANEPGNDSHEPS